MSQRRIAVLIAGLLAGAQVGGAAINDESNLPPSAEQEYLEPAPEQAEYVESAPAQSEPADQVTVTGSTSTILAPVSGDAFPVSNSPEDMRMLPAQLAYFDRLEADRLAAGIQWVARGDAFPRSNAVEDMSPLPAQIAYFDGREATRVATNDQTGTSSSMSLRGVGEKLANLLRPRAEPQAAPRAESAEQEIPQSGGLADDGSSSGPGS